MNWKHALWTMLASIVIALFISGNTMEKAAAIANAPDPTVHDLQDELRALRLKMAKTEGEFAALKHIVLSKKRAYDVTATAYSPRAQETDDTPWETATLTRCAEGRTIAVSQDHVDWLGRRVYIPGYGVRVVEDLMHKRFTDRIDFFIEDTTQAAHFGVKQLKIILLD